MNLTDGLCWYCGAPADTIDHMQPRSKGGTNQYGNLVPCCDECNQRKSNLNVKEYRRRMVDVAMSNLRFGNKEARRLFIDNYEFYGEKLRIDPFLPKRLAEWRGFGRTQWAMNSDDNSLWCMRLWQWAKRTAVAKKIYWFRSLLARVFWHSWVSSGSSEESKNSV